MMQYYVRIKSKTITERNRKYLESPTLTRSRMTKTIENLSIDWDTPVSVRMFWASKECSTNTSFQASDYYLEGEQSTFPERIKEFKDIHRIAGVLQKHVQYCNRKILEAAVEVLPVISPSVTATQKSAANLTSPSEKGPFPDFDADELGAVLKQLIAKVQIHQAEIKKAQHASTPNHKAALLRIGLL